MSFTVQGDIVAILRTRVLNWILHEIVNTLVPDYGTGEKFSTIWESGHQQHKGVIEKFQVFMAACSALNSYRLDDFILETMEEQGRFWSFEEMEWTEAVQTFVAEQADTLKIAAEAGVDHAMDR